MRDSVENIRAAGYLNGKPAILVVIFRQPGANIIETVDRSESGAAVAQGVDPCGDKHARLCSIGPRRFVPRFLKSSAHS